MATEIQQKQSDIKSLRLQQKKLSRRIGQAKAEGQDVEALLTEIQEISATIKSLDAECKQAMSGHNQAVVQAVTTPKAHDFSFVPVREAQDAPAADAVIVMRADFVTAAEEEAVELYIKAHEGSTPYHRPCVLQAVQSSFGHDAAYFVARDAGRVVGVLPVTQLNSRLFGNYCVSLPFFNYGGVLADSVEIASRLLSEAKCWAQAREACHVEYRYSSQLKSALPEKSDKVSFYLALPSTVAELRQQFKSKLRSQIKKAESYPHEVKHGGAELVEDFYRVFSENMRDLGTPVYSKSFFYALARALQDRLSICVVYYDAKPAAAAIVIGHKGRLEIPWASTIRRYNPKSVNMLLYWRVLSWAVENHYESFDFGRCSRDAGTYKFKAQWGAVEQPLYWQYQLLSGEMPALNTKNSKFRLLIAIWQKLPLWLANLVGPQVVKYLP
jgi:FemAB-related protein (PEP-CTERM system-associated)